MSLLLVFLLLACAAGGSTGVAASPLLLQHEPLPYADTALEPHISQRTLQIHHGKHHAKYVNTANAMLESATHSKYHKYQTVQELLQRIHADLQDDHQHLDEETRTSLQGLFNNVAQSWNHAFYWKCMAPPQGGSTSSSSSSLPTDSPLLREQINSHFGSWQEFISQFAQAGNTAFGSGWAWLVYSRLDKRLFVTKTIGAGNPMTTPGWIPLLTMDVWEHAYYLDYQNLRNQYVDTFLEKLVNWRFVQENLERAMDDNKGDEL